MENTDDAQKSLKKEREKKQKISEKRRVSSEIVIDGRIVKSPPPLPP